MLKLEFGVPSQRSTKTEKYPNLAVMTMLAYKGKGCAKKFEFNKKAEELLNLNGENDAVCMSFSPTEIYIVKSNGTEPEFYNVTKNSPKSFSNSRVYGYISKLLKVNEEIDNEFVITPHESDMYGSAPICSIQLIENNPQALEVQESTTSIEVLDLPESVVNDSVDFLTEVTNEEVSMYSSTSHNADGLTNVVQVSSVQ